MQDLPEAWDPYAGLVGWFKECTQLVVECFKHHGLLVERFTVATGGRCTADGCYRLRAEGSTACVNHLKGDAGT